MPKNKPTAAEAKSRFAEARADVAKIFDSPAELLAASDLNQTQKIDLLRQWESDLRLLLVAAEENMPESGKDERTAERLRAVRHALDTLGASGGQENVKPA